MIKTTLPVFLLALFLLAACNMGINKEALYGDWKYIKIDKPNSDDAADTVTTDELNANSPYISFSKNDELTIHWGGKVLSHGSFTVSGKNINYTEQLPGGKKRTFPFWVSQLDDKTIVFETMGNDGSRVKAIKK